METSRILRVLALLAALAAAGCAGDRVGDPFAAFKWPTLGSDREREKPQSPINMAGRWLLSQPNRGQCNMNFSGGPQASEGSIAPEGGCPGKFFTSRKWTLEAGNVIIRDHNGEQLAQLSPAGAGRFFEGPSTSGERVMLARQSGAN
jgi:hypothetical protein